ncbi:hypothetical protein [Streptomyces sp. AK02-01A]|uniref:hypothetical protein n=1 Tax=Streptomyces sp. AK02-01A TaxID=3028648 RepID=UPI0029A7E6FE|nr:hypothetical protein [Streptomyces sp. AK02-01A]MDX3850764.1 hypothetical protein [Streptomyces sp. AK02-01A]
MNATSWARAITNILQPRNVLLSGMLGVSLAASGDWTGIPWGLTGALCAGIIPASYVEWERKRGTWGDRHVVDRRQRAPIFLVILASIGAGVVVMVLGHAPRDIIMSMISAWAMTVGLLAVNYAWKISVDAAVASSVTAMLCVVHSPWWIIAYALVFAVCWSRVALSYHTVAQTAAGALLGASTAAVFLAV